MSNTLRLAELLAARLCHDLSGPLVSLSAALELAEPGSVPGDDEAEAQALAQDAVRELGQRLRLLRAAWGEDGAALGAADLQDLAGGLPNARRVRVDLSELDPAAFPPAAARVALNILLLGAESLPAGGVLALSGSAARDVVATIDGPRAAWPAGFAAWLADADAAWDALTEPRRLQGPLTALIAHQAGLRLSLLLAIGSDPRPAPLRLSLGD